MGVNPSASLCAFLSHPPGPTPDELYGRYDPSLLYPSSNPDEAAQAVSFLRGVHPEKTTVVTMELCLGSASKCVSEISADDECVGSLRT